MSSEIETTPLTPKLLQQALSQSVAEIPQSEQGVQYLATAYTSTLTHHGIEISLVHRECPWKNGHVERNLSKLSRRERLISRLISMTV